MDSSKKKEMSRHLKTKGLLKGVGGIFSLVLLFLLILPVVPILASDSQQLVVYSSSSDGRLDNSGAVYTTVHDGDGNYKEDTAYEFYVGQVATATPTYNIFRNGLFFDTSPLPNDAVIDSCVLRLYVEEAHTDAAFNIIIVDGSVLHNPMVVADYRALLPQTISGGSIAADDSWSWEYIDIDLNTVGLSWISTEGITKLSLRSSREINSDVPGDGTNEKAIFETSEQLEEYAPRLVINYHVPLEIPSPIQNLVKVGLTTVWIGVVITMVFILASAEAPLIIIVVSAGIMTIIGSIGIQMLVSAVSNW